MRSIWAVAANTIAQALRLKVAVIFMILLLILLPVMSRCAAGDGTIKGKLQTFVSYGLSLTNLLLCLLTIIVSTYTVTSDIEQKQVYTVLTKPIRRYQFLCGKLLGVALLDVLLLAVFAGLIYGLTLAIPRALDAEADDITQLDNEFFTARASLIPVLDEDKIAQEAAQEYKDLEATGRLPSRMSRSRILAELTSQKKLERRAVAAAGQIKWEFTNVRPLDPDQLIFIRYKYEVSVTPPDLNVYGRWFIGDDRQYQFGYKMKTPIYVFERKETVRTFHEIPVPADAVASDGYLAVIFESSPINGTVVIFPLEDGLEVLYKADSFTWNFVRAALIILARLIFLAALGLSASTWLSFPVAILVCCVVYLAASISGFFLESIELFSTGWERLYSFTVRPIFALLPQFDKFNPVNNMVSARLLTWTFLARVFAVMVCIKAALLWFLGMLIFTYREIAKISV